MANYLVWYGKKRATFRRRETDLLRFIYDGGPVEQLLRAAVLLRESKLRYLKSEYSRLDLGDGRHLAQLMKLNRSMEEWATKEPRLLIEEYRQQLDEQMSADS